MDRAEVLKALKSPTAETMYGAGVFLAGIAINSLSVPSLLVGTSLVVHGLVRSSEESPTDSLDQTV